VVQLVRHRRRGRQQRERHVAAEGEADEPEARRQRGQQRLRDRVHGLQRRVVDRLRLHVRGQVRAQPVEDRGRVVQAGHEHEGQGHRQAPQ